METWLKYSLLLCVFGFVKEFRPSEPFVTHYLTGQWKNFTEGDIEAIFSTGTYAYLVEIIFVFLLTDLLRYKPVIILDGIFAIITWSLLIWGESTFQMQVMEVFYAFFSAAEVAYYTYIYAQVDTEHYQKVTSHTRAAYLFGRALSGIVSQILVWNDAMDYYQLNFITLGAVIFATIWALFLPRVKHSIYFYRDNMRNKVNGIDNKGADFSDTPDNTKAITSPSIEHGDSSSTSANNKITFYTRSRMAFYYLWDDLITAYSNVYVIKWSLWWAFATCGFLQVLNYVQLVWENVVAKSGEELENGIVEAAYTLIGAATSLGCGWLRFNWQVLGESTLAICSAVQGVLLIVIASTHTMVAEYICYVAFGVLYHTMITVANTEIAKELRDDSYGLIFGVNMFVALIFQTILTFVVVDENGPFDLSVEMQFQTYGVYFLALGGLFGLATVYTLIFNQELCRSKLWLPKESETVESIPVERVRVE